MDSPIPLTTFLEDGGEGTPEIMLGLYRATWVAPRANPRSVLVSP